MHQYVANDFRENISGLGVWFKIQKRLNGDFSFYKTLVSYPTPSFSPSKMSWKPMINHCMACGRQSQEPMYTTLYIGNQSISQIFTAIVICHQLFIEMYDKIVNSDMAPLESVFKKCQILDYFGIQKVANKAILTGIFPTY